MNTGNPAPVRSQRIFLYGTPHPLRPTPPTAPSHAPLPYSQSRHRVTRPRKICRLAGLYRAPSAPSDPHPNLHQKRGSTSGSDEVALLACVLGHAGATCLLLTNTAQRAPGAALRASLGRSGSAGVLGHGPPTARTNARTTCTRIRPPRLTRTRQKCRCVGAWSTNRTHSRTPYLHQEPPPSSPHSDEEYIPVGRALPSAQRTL